jgi:nucleotidyltransferase DUF2204
MAGSIAQGRGGTLDQATREFYQAALGVIKRSGLPFMVGGAYAFNYYTGVERHTKDFDIFVREVDCQRALDIFARAGYHAELTHPHWLGKAYCGDDAYMDIIFNSGNGVARVDDEWFARAHACEILGIPVKLIPAEEMIWSKGFIMERERFDGADVAHLIHAWTHKMDWHHLLDRYGAHWRVLYCHLVLFGYDYPGERDKIPGWILRELTGRLLAEVRTPPVDERLCQGTLVSREQFLPDVEQWGYSDARAFHGFMSPEDIQHWTDAIAGAHD